MSVFAVANQFLQTFTAKVFCLASRREPLSFPFSSEMVDSSPSLTVSLSHCLFKYKALDTGDAENLSDMRVILGLPFRILEVIIAPMATRSPGLSHLPKDCLE